MDRSRLFEWVESFHYKPDLVKVTYGLTSDKGVHDRWVMKFDTGDIVVVDGCSDGDLFTLYWRNTAFPDHAPPTPRGYLNLKHSLEGIIRDVYWYGLNSRELT